MVVLFDTVRRTRPVREGGELVMLDWNSKRVLKSLPIYPEDPDILNDPNPRGNSRGGKGILVSEEEVFVGTYHTILVFDRLLNRKGKISHPLFAGLHEMGFAGTDIWVAATAIDAALLVDRRGSLRRSWWPREDLLLQERYGLFPMDIDKKADNRIRYLHEVISEKEGHTHLNAVVHSRGRTFVLLNRLGLVVQIEPETKVVLEDKRIRGGHSPVVLEDRGQLALCSSFEKDILFFDLLTGQMAKRIHLLDFAEVARLHRDHPDRLFSKSIFVRGLEVIASDRILAGIAPASILEIDIDRGRLVDFYQHSTHIADAVHGLAHISGRGNS
jgi:hypothetical protein